MGLRARITLAFALGTLLVSAVLAGATLGLTRENLLDQREAAATVRTYQNARSASLQLPGPAGSELQPASNPSVVLASLPTSSGSNPVLEVDGSWYARVPELGEDVIPAELREMVQSGQAALMRFDHEGSTQLVVGVPLESIDGAYFEIVSLDELENTLESISISLLAAALLATMAGCSGRCAGSATPRRPWPAASSRPASRPAMTPTWPRWPTRSTTWRSRSRSASSATPASPRTSATSCARR
jgi:hypothetical protein